MFQKIQALARGVLSRRHYCNLSGSLADATLHLVIFQGYLRGALVRRRTTFFRQSVVHSTRSVTVLQAQARGVLVRFRQDTIFLSFAQAAQSICRSQATLRGVLLRRQIRDTSQSLLEVAQPIGAFQAVLRGYLVRRRNSDALRSVICLQAIVRGVLFRRQISDILQSLLEAVQPIGALQAGFGGYLVRRQINNILQSIGCSQAKSYGIVLWRRINDIDITQLFYGAAEEIGALQARLQGHLLRYGTNGVLWLSRCLQAKFRGAPFQRQISGIAKLFTLQFEFWGHLVRCQNGDISWLIGYSQVIRFRTLLHNTSNSITQPSHNVSLLAKVLQAKFQRQTSETWHLFLEVVQPIQWLQAVQGTNIRM